MPAHRSPPARLIGLVVSGVLATSGLLVVLASDDEADSASVPIVAQRARAVEAQSPEWQPPALDPVMPIDVSAAPAASPGVAEVDPGLASPLAARIELTIERMAATLRDGPVDRSSWETGVRALAGSLGPESIPQLLELAANTSLPDEQLVAVAELLRPWSAGPDGFPAPLPEPALAALRRSVDEQPRQPAATAAARALGALGTRDDTARLLDDLVDPASRSLASWGLQASPSVTLLDELAGLLATDIDVESQAAVLTTMEGWARSATPDVVEGSSRDASAAAIAALLDDATLEPAVRQRAASALVAIGGGSARRAVEQICRDPASEDELIRVGVAALARDADPEAIALLENGLWNAATPDPRRLDFAEGLARIAAPSSSRPALLEIAFANERPADQRRALYSLATLSPGSDTAAAAATALGDRDPAVRAAAIWALDRTALAPAHIGQLRGLSESDSSEDVRRLARRALERIAR